MRVLGEDHRVVVGEGHAASHRSHAPPRRSPRAWRRRAGGPSRGTCEMSQFWQNLQARLQPAVPKREHAGAGVEVVERLLLDRVDAEARAAPVGGEHHRVADARRTKHRPRWPSCSRQSRGQRSHWMRPSSSWCHQRAGCGLTAVPPLRMRSRRSRRHGRGRRPCRRSCREPAGAARAVPARRQQRAVDRRSAARLVRAEAGVERQDGRTVASSAACASSW